MMSTQSAVMRAAAATVMTLFIASCGSDGKSSGSVDAADSEFCGTARQWAVHEIDPVDDSTPAAFEKYWTEYLAYVDGSVATAPPSIKAQQIINSDAVKEKLTPLLEKYGFDTKLLADTATEAEQAVLDEPPAAVQQAQADIHEYESRVCGTEPGAAAEGVTFEPDASAAAYCAKSIALQARFDDVTNSAADVAVVRAYATDPAVTDLLDGMATTAPAAIKPDVVAMTAWLRTEWRAVLAKWDYDIRRLILQGSADDRAAFQQTDPQIGDHHARMTAYDEQICATS